MVDVEFRVVGQRREGLLLALGQVVIASGYTLLRQRMASEAEGVVLTMRVRGPAEHLLQLEERLGTHPLVGSFEATSDVARGEARPVEARALDAPAVAPSTGAIDHARAERLLPQLARSYPKCFLFLHALDHELAPEHRAPTLAYIGQRVGAWVHKRDFALGAPLAPAHALRQIALPALRQVVAAELDGDAIAVRDSPFPDRGHAGPCCHFLRGMLEGLLGAARDGAAIRVTETHCRNTGAAACRFAID